MEIKELRIGNLINGLYYDDEDEKTCICEVVAIDSTDNPEHPIWVESTANVEVFSSFEPIQLTEEVLLKCGGIDKGYTIEFKAGRKKIVFYWGSKVVSTGERFGWYCLKYKNIKHLHRLQNLYFELSDKELTYNHS